MFVDRDGSGTIVASYNVAQREGHEEIDDDDAGLLSFIAAIVDPEPGQVSAGQLIQALAELDLLDAVDAVVSQADPLTQRLWARAPTFPRNDPMVLAIAAAVGQTSEQLDDIFRLAAAK